MAGCDGGRIDDARDGLCRTPGWMPGHRPVAPKHEQSPGELIIRDLHRIRAFVQARRGVGGLVPPAPDLARSRAGARLRSAGGDLDRVS
jgi:hypothetical protein